MQKLAEEEHYSSIPGMAGHLQQKRLISRLCRWLSVFWDLFFIRWANIRNEWYFHVILGPIFPLALLIFMRMMKAIPDPETAFYVAAGNAILMLIMGPMQSLSNDLAIARQRNDLEYFAVLPFSRLQLVLAFCAVSSFITIPTKLLTVTIAALWLGFPLSPNPLVLVVMLVAGFSMAGVGVFIGVHAKNIHHANIMNMMVMMSVMFMSPVIIPRENLPLILQWTSRFLPPSYAADGFRAALAGNYGWESWFNIGMLLFFALVLLTFATRKIDWR